MLQHKNQSSESKNVCGFSIILILKGIMFVTQRGVHVFCWTKKWSSNKNEMESKMKNPTHNFRKNKPCASVYIRMAS